LNNDKYVLIDFWGTWCPPCIADNPIILNYYLRYYNYTEILSVGCLEPSIQKYLQVINRDNMVWNHVHQESDNTVMNQYNVDNFPTVFLLSPSGLILTKQVGSGGVKNIYNSLAETYGWVENINIQSNIFNLAVKTGEKYKLIEGTHILFEGYNTNIEFIVNRDETSNEYDLTDIQNKINQIITTNTIFEDCYCFCDSNTLECLCVCAIPIMNSSEQNNLGLIENILKAEYNNDNNDNKLVFSLIEGTYNFGSQDIQITYEIEQEKMNSLEEAEFKISSLFKSLNTTINCTCICKCDAITLICTCICTCKIKL
jgi:thiol-disulfide isomerase/thioredoxin